MWRALFLILVVMCSTFFAQTAEKPKAYLFDEFGKIDQVEIKARTENFRKKLEQSRSSRNFDDAYLFFYYENEKELKKTQNLIEDVLYRECRDCFDNVRITFLNAGKVKKPKTQFWLAPAGVKPPEPIIDEEIK